MSIKTKDSSAPPTLAAALLSATGYFTVAVACAWAGYALRHQHILIAATELPFLAVGVAALLPAYVNRGILYELKRSHQFNHEDHNRRWLRTLSVQLPLLIGMGIGIVVWIIDVYSRQGAAYNLWRVALHVLIAMGPIYLISFRLTKRWLQDETLFAFRFRSFFPAFATCLMPFTLGYSDLQDVSCTAIGAALVIGYWVVALYTSTRTTALIGGGLLLLIVIWQGTAIGLTTMQAECARVLFFGTVMTLLMGVSEAWRVTTRVLNDQDFRLSAYSPREKNFYLGGTNLATALFVPFFLLTFLDPSTTRLYLLLFLMLLACQYVSWYVDRTPNKSTAWPGIGIASGFLVPVTIGVCAQIARNLEILGKFKSIPSDLGPLVEVIGADIAMAVYLTERGVRHLARQSRNAPNESRLVSFLTPYPCICLTGVLSAVFSILIILYGSASSFVAATEARLASLVAVYSFISGICAAAILINFFYTKMSDHGEGRSRSSLIEGRLEKETGARYIQRIPKGVQAFIGMTRPAPCLIAGLLTMLIAQRYNSLFAIRAGISMTLVVMFGFVVDNICDFNDDVLAGVRTPLSSQLMSVSSARRLALLLALLALVVSPTCEASLLVLSPTLLALLCYSQFSRLFPLLKGIYTAGLVCVPLVYPSFLTGARIPIRYYVILVLFIVAREAFIDSCQSATDRKAGRSTCAVIWDCDYIKKWSRCVMVLAAAILTIVISRPLPKGLATLSLMITAFILYSPFIKQRQAGYLRISMVFGAVALALCAS